MSHSPVSLNPANMYVNPMAKAMKPADYDKDIKELHKFKDMLANESKKITKSKIDGETKADIVHQLDIQMQLTENKIQQLATDKEMKFSAKAIKNYGNTMQSPGDASLDPADATLEYYAVSILV